jgi:hypothetical protein
MAYAFKQCKLDFLRVANPSLREVFAKGRAMFFLQDLADGSVAVLAAKAGNGATRSWSTGITNPVHPRSLHVVFAGAYDGGNVTITGRDQFGRNQTETIVASAGNTVQGTKIWRSISRIALPTTAGGNAATMTVETGSDNLIGLPVPLSGTWGLGLHDGTAEIMTWNATVHAFTPTTTPDGSVDFTVLVPVDWQSYYEMLVLAWNVRASISPSASPSLSPSASPSASPST